MMHISAYDEQLCASLRDLPRKHANRYDDTADNDLRATLFQHLTHNFNPLYVPLFFPNGIPTPRSDTSNPPFQQPPPADPAQAPQKWSLRLAQGATGGAEYSAAAKGHRCGHIFKAGEATYRCMTCADDETCVLCAKCFDASDHEGHHVFVNISTGNCGCCDCGDDEAWIRPIHCNIHTATAAGGGPDDGSMSLDQDIFGVSGADKGKEKDAPLPSEEILESIRMTIARAWDYVCDVFSCSPEQLRLPRSKESIREDERLSRLTSKWYGGPNPDEPETEFALVLWNDEKHTIEDVRDQVAKACRRSKAFASKKAREVDDVGRSVIEYSTDIEDLLKKAKIIEEIKVTVTIRSSRDTFRENMCGTIIDWMSDISGCSVGRDSEVLRGTICEEMMKAWRTGSEASNIDIGQAGLDDHQSDDVDLERRQIQHFIQLHHRNIIHVEIADAADIGFDNDDNDAGESDTNNDDDEMDIDFADSGDPNALFVTDHEGDLDMDNLVETGEATLAGYPPPPPPPAHSRPLAGNPLEPADPMEDASTSSGRALFSDIPRTPSVRPRPRPPRPPKYWLENPTDFGNRASVPIHENLWQRIRLDYLILYDLRMWKKLRDDLRDIYLSTVVVIPSFKRVLGLRFAGLYPKIAQLYLIADREPDHSIINLSIQLFTTPSITAEIVERGNFLTNLLAILYTFLTTRQVGLPSDVSPNGALAFDSGAVTNRRLYHFFQDLRFLFASEFVQERLCTEERYFLQFLDLVKLHQGICPNVRAVGNHVEYETDAWISASLIIREINKLCRQISESFKWTRDQDPAYLERVIRQSARTAIFNSLGCERKRFEQSELKSETKFKTLITTKEYMDYFGRLGITDRNMQIVDFKISEQPISFHHALHYLLSWLIDCGKGMSVERLRELLTFNSKELKSQQVSARTTVPEISPHSYLLALFDFPLRVCAWLAQMKVNVWVRNGFTLRHQMQQYKGISQRDIAYQRDIFLLQVALVTCEPSVFLYSMIHRFQLTNFLDGNYGADYAESDHTIGIVEEFAHLLIVLLCDRLSLLPQEDNPNAHIIAMRRDIAHVLCLKRLSFSEISARLADKLYDSKEFQDVLEDVTQYKAPEGVSDSGLFSLKEECLDEIDPYVAHYNKNQREEAENVYRNYVSRKTGKPLSEVIFEPKLHNIETGIFVDLPRVTRIPLFGVLIYHLLNYAKDPEARDHAHTKWKVVDCTESRTEAYLNTVLHLVLVAVLCDRSTGMEDDNSSFTDLALASCGGSGRYGQLETPIFLTLQQMSLSNEAHMQSCASKCRLILRRMKEKRPHAFAEAMASAGLGSDWMETTSSAGGPETDREAKKKQALERQARVMASFKQQQNNFIQNQAFDWGKEDLSDMDSDFESAPEVQEKVWRFPSGTCILCQEETNDDRLYGTFGLLVNSNILRQTVLGDEDYVAEVVNLPDSLDRSAEHIRPYGVAGQNRRIVSKVRSDGQHVTSERQELAKGFPKSHHLKGPVSVGCGHIMHYPCFRMYVEATRRRHNNQIARKHPEKPEKCEFLCPLCKALGNVFLPIVWKNKTETYPGVLQPEETFETWLDSKVAVNISRLSKSPDRQETETLTQSLRHQALFMDYWSEASRPEWTASLPEIIKAKLPTSVSSMHPATTAHSLNSLIGMLSQTQEEPSRDAALRWGEEAAQLANPTPAGILMSIFKRLRETIRTNKFHTLFEPSEYASEDMDFINTLGKTIGFSISAVEIAARGTDRGSSPTFVGSLSEQTLTHLRILVETVSSYYALGCLRNQGRNRAMGEFTNTQNRQLYQLFSGHSHICGDMGPKEHIEGKIPPLLGNDTFLFLAGCSVCLVPALKLDIHHVLRLCYIAEIVKVILAFLTQRAIWKLLQTNEDLPEAEDREDGKDAASAEYQRVFGEFVKCVQDMRVGATGDPFQQFSRPRQPEAEVHFYAYLERLVQKYALTFLRKAAILTHVQYNVDFSSVPVADAGAGELERLSHALRLPSIRDLLAETMAPTPAAHLTRCVIEGWIRHWAAWNASTETPPMSTLSLSHPAIPELVGLPKHHATLTDEAMQRRCPTTGKELTDPCLCLFCGDIFCSQAMCCAIRDREPGGQTRGGCSQHLDRCGGPVGLFINIRKCEALYLNGDHGSFFPAPYLDRHGEADGGFRRHHQLFLNQKRYDVLLRQVWLQHGIPSMISRKLEMENNTGGWETL